ncbi:MAG: deoxyhypusine synthase family protein, partial [Deltaproteobacteria bacterium]|nr:deoxyhypusine synthase family protein [Deltaproteobacteria bacterium]
MTQPKKPFFRELHDGSRDGLTPLRSLDLKQIPDFSTLLDAMSHTAFSGRSLGEAQDILAEMVTDPDCLVVGTF